MARLYVVRHAEAEGNLYRRAHGHYDSLVTPNGQAQIGALRQRFAAVRFDGVYTSDLGRARRTAGALTPADGRAIQSLPALREIHLGAWEDRPWGELARADAARYAVFGRDPWQFSVPEGESMRTVWDRVYRAARAIAAAHPLPSETVAIISHGVAIRSLLARLSGLPPARLAEIPHSDNTSVSCLDWDGAGAPVVRALGDGSHLGALSTFARQHWWRSGQAAETDVNLWFRPICLPEDADLAYAFRRDAWVSVYGHTRGFSEPATRTHTVRMAGAHPRAVVFAMRGETAVGLLELDVQALTPDNTGHLSLVYLRADARGQMLGAQLVGHAVSVYRSLGRHALHLRVAESNRSARRFYEKMGFVHCTREDAPHGTLFALQMRI
ncbi:MAG: GNAT family N-acetyltransferase [Oscillospiraceae bacterium]|jgi:probable phosphoglycerate mutase|nr:GNAT family N-acetyltransferase [Oscillospiraceae bacterium]